MSAAGGAPRRAAAPAAGLVLLAVSSLQVGAAFAALTGFVVLDQGLAARDWLAVGLVVVASAGASTLRG